MTLQCAVIDDYQDAARRFADWSLLGDRVELTVFTDHLTDEDAVAHRLAPFDVVVIMRERTPSPATLLARHPRARPGGQRPGLNAPSRCGAVVRCCRGVSP